MTYALMWLLCVCNKLNQNILGLDFRLLNLYTITPGLAPLIHLFLSVIINVDLKGTKRQHSGQMIQNIQN